MWSAFSTSPESVVARFPEDRVVAIAGVKWNAAATWLVTANLARSLTNAGLTARWVSTVGAEYAFGE